jgi:2-polyprenyl-3-methyl-5-hydroxy-6-metoxy-1,4-benzoquinol methylase
VHPLHQADHTGLNLAVMFSRCNVCDAELQPWFERREREVFRCPTCRHIQVPAGVAHLANGVSIYESEQSDVFEAFGSLEYYLDDATYRAAVTKAEFVRRFVSSGTLLDVGASFGHFLAAARETFTAYGVESHPRAVEWSRSTFEVQNVVGSVYAIPSALPAPFDVVSAWDVIEHLDEPRRALTMCRSYLKPGGWLFLSTPDAGSIVSRLLGSRWLYQDPVQHVNLFSRANLSRSLEECGFELVAHTYFGRRYRLSYVLNRLAYLLQDHPTRHVIGSMKRLPERVLQSTITLKLWDVMGLAARVRD